MKYLATLVLLYAAAVQSCQRVAAAEPMRHKTNLEIFNEGLGIKITVKIEATTYQGMVASREAILNRLADQPPKVDALNAPEQGVKAPADGETKGFR